MFAVQQEDQSRRFGLAVTESLSAVVRPFDLVSTKLWGIHIVKLRSHLSVRDISKVITCGGQW